MPRDPEKRVVDLHDHLAATAERPIERTASRWIGEAEAIVEDLVGSDVDPAVRRERIGHVCDLLSNVPDLEDSEAREHVEAAREIAEDLA